MRIAIVGGGSTGVELAAELVQMTESAAAYVQSLPPHVALVLFESGPRLLPSLPESISRAVEPQLRALGIEVRTSTKVAAAEPGGYRLADGSLIEATILVWAAGVQSAEVLSSLDGLDATRNHRLRVQPSLQTTRDDRIFAIGDCASFTPQGGDGPLPPTAQVANQQAQHLVRHLPAWLNGAALPPFRYHDFGSLVSLGRYNAFGSLARYGFFVAPLSADASLNWRTPCFTARIRCGCTACGGATCCGSSTASTRWSGRRSGWTEAAGRAWAAQRQHGRLQCGRCRFRAWRTLS